MEPSWCLRPDATGVFSFDPAKSENQKRGGATWAAASQDQSLIVRP